MDHTDFAFDAARFAQGNRCPNCKGTGARGRGKCNRCDGAGAAGSLDMPRVRFNWGYHDARHNVRMGRPRVLLATGPQSLHTVSAAFDFWYAAGYAFGLRDAAVETDTSAPAWTEWTGLDSDGQPAPAAA